MDLQSFIPVEADPGGSYPISLVVGDNFNTASFVDSGIKHVRRHMRPDNNPYPTQEYLTIRNSLVESRQKKTEGDLRCAQI
jgi:hypothetical protein